MKKRISILFCVLLNALFVHANNLHLSGMKLTDSRHISVTVSWENSWKLEGIAAPGNHDAVWIFLKYKASGKSWDHLQVSDIDSMFGIDTSLLTIETVADKNGFFLKRKNTGSGNVIATQIIIPIDNSLPTGDYDFRVFGIEMVWINEGPFFIGDAWAQKCLSRGDSLSPFHITSENAIATGTDSLSLRDTGEYDPKSAIPGSYPKGYHGFYCMKYEISQEQYADFLNCLDFRQQKNRCAISPDATKGSGITNFLSRNGIAIEESGNDPDKAAVFSCNLNKDNVFNDAADAKERACNYLSWADVSAYLDWAALRPLSDLEFEKVCRGPSYPIKGEFPWGTASSVDANTLKNDGTDSETVSDKIPAGTGVASYGYTGPQGPLRSGFAARDTTNRLTSGSSYYGAMEMSGNVWETIVNLNPKGLKYDGKTGDGKTDADGNADVQNWPGTDADGSGYRGGAWLSGVLGEFRDPAISARFYAGLKADQRRNTSGGRGGR